MVSKREYKSAMGKVTAGEEFKKQLENSLAFTSIDSSVRKPKASWKRKLVPSFVALIIIAFVSSALLPSLLKDPGKIDDSVGFKIIDQNTDTSDEYIEVVYLEGFAYSPSGWIRDYEEYYKEYEAIKGEKLGEVNLDLRGLKYRGTPPDFSSTLDVGTEIYTIKDIKKERAVLVIRKDVGIIFDRTRKALPNGHVSIDLLLSDVFNMMTDSPAVSSIELRSEYDGARVKTSENQELISLINQELPGLSLLNYFEIGEDPYSIDQRIPVNLLFPDGAALHMQVFPKAQKAYVFGGFVKLSPELCNLIKDFPDGER